MVNVFLSYRRSDSGWAGRIQESLKRKRDVVVLRDITEIRLGDEFPRCIQEMIEKCNVAVVLIGRGWVEDIERLKNESDWVRREIAFCRSLNKPILPVLVDSVSMPASNLLPDEFQKLADWQSILVGDQSFDNDLSKLAESIKNAFRQYNEYQTWTTLNGLRGALKLASCHVSGAKFETDDIRRLAAELVHDLFVDSENGTAPTTASQYRLVDNDENYRSLLLQGVSYKTVELNAEVKVQIGVKLAKSAVVGVIYEEMADKGDRGRLIIVFYTVNTDDLPDISSILAQLSEPRPVSATEYRLPYKSVFISKVVSDNVFRNTYMPYKEGDEIASEVFVKLFDMKWLGTSEMNRASLQDLHTHIMSQYSRFTIVHAIKSKNKTVI